MGGAEAAAQDNSDVVGIVNPDGAGPVILVCEHASSFIPPEFAGLGLPDTLMDSHIAWDPGAFEVARMMSRMLDAPLVHHTVSRLLYDCNRPPEAQSAIPSKSEIHDIPGNRDLSEPEKKARAERFYYPFKTALARLISHRMGRQGDPVLATIHTFTPHFRGEPRDLGVGILHDTDSRLADAMIDRMAGDPNLDVRRNEPYGPQDGVTHTLVEHAIPQRLLNVMIEIRNDLVAAAPAQQSMARKLADHVRHGIAGLRSEAADRAPSENRKRI